MLGSLLLGFCFFALSAGSVLLTRFDGGAAFIWLASAPLLVVLLTRPVRGWLSPLVCCALASCCSTSMYGLGIKAALPLAVPLVGEALFAAVLLRLFGAETDPLDDVRVFARFVAIVGLVVPALSGLPAAAVICAASQKPFGSVYLPWISAHALGFLTIAPLLMLCLQSGARAELQSLGKRQAFEAFGLLAGVAAVCIFVFRQDSMPLLFLPILPLVATTFRLGRLGATAAVAILAICGGGFTLAGHGPVALMAAAAGLKAQFFQFYLVVAIMIVLPAAAELRRRDALFLRLQESEAGMRLLTANLGDVLLHTDCSGTIRYASPSIRSLAGVAPQTAHGRNLADIILEEDVPTFTAARLLALSDTSESVTVAYRVPMPSGIEWREAHLRAYSDQHDQVVGIVLTVRDATERMRQQDELRAAASIDPLTGIANRRAFAAALERCSHPTATRSENCLMIFDIDHFKRVNDRHGHAAGDRVIKNVAEAAHRALRHSDFLARIGGEEFAALLPGASLAEAEAACERVRTCIEVLSVEARDGEPAIRVTISVGLVLIVDGMGWAAALEAADRALYAAKDAGRNRLQIAA